MRNNMKAICNYFDSDIRIGLKWFTMVFCNYLIKNEMNF